MTNPNDDKSSSISEPGVVSPSGHQYLEWALKSPVKNTAKGFSALILAYKLLKFDKKVWKLGELWSKAGLRYKTVKKFFFLPNFSSTTMDSSKDKLFLITTGREFLLKRPTPPRLVFAELLTGTKVYSSSRVSGNSTESFRQISQMEIRS